MYLVGLYTHCNMMHGTYSVKHLCVFIRLDFTIQNVCVVALNVVFFSVAFRFFFIGKTDKLPKLRKVTKVTLMTTDLIENSSFCQVRLGRKTQVLWDVTPFRLVNSFGGRQYLTQDPSWTAGP